MIVLNKQKIKEQNQIYHLAWQEDWEQETLQQEKPNHSKYSLHG